MINEKLWKNWRRNLEEKFSRRPLEIIQWEATRRCDLHCRHCGSPKETVAEGKELDTAEVISAFAQIRRDFPDNRLKFIALTGGEPFLRADLLEIVSAFHSYGWLTTIHTNGNFLAQNPNMIKQLLVLGVRGIGLNLDGLPESHDWLRCRAGHYDQTMQLAHRLIKHSDILHLTLTTVLHQHNVDQLTALWKEIERLNPHRWRLLPMERIGRADQNSLYFPEWRYPDLLDFIRKIRLEKTAQRAVQAELGCIGWLGREWEGWVRPYIWSCIAGRTCLGILYDGSLSACAHCHRAFIQGNIRDGNIKDIWENRFEVFRFRQKQSACEGCSELEYCTLPMHKLDGNGKIRDCVFQRLKERR